MSRAISPIVRVLVTEDDLLMRWSVTEVLTAAGAWVTEAADGLAAIAVVGGSPHRFDVALLDVHLPDSSSLGLLATIRQLSPLTRVLLMTAFGTSELRSMARAFGAESLLEKPFDLHRMSDLVMFPPDHQARSFSPGLLKIPI
jgi:DNA-binding response OmpR family regulator